MAYPGLLHSFHRRLAGEGACSLAGVVGELIPKHQLDRLRGSGCRRRVFMPAATFWSFLAQVLSPTQPCREAVRQVQAMRRLRRKSTIASGTGAYCQARRRLPEPVLERISEGIAGMLAEAAAPARLWRGLRVGVVDGTGASMPDTPANQAAWPQSRRQKPGCGFPVMKLVGLFSLATGAVHSVATGTLHDAEQVLLCRQLWNPLCHAFDLLLGDRAFGSYALFAALRYRGLNGVFRLHQARKVNWRKGKRLGKSDRVFTWNKPDDPLLWWLAEPVPPSLQIRILKVLVPITGFRTRVLLVSTDLLDAKRFPPEAIAELYRRRWQIELFFRHIKTTMHMEVLRCKTPAMVRRELRMHMIAYNLIRALMMQSALSFATPICRISFKGTCDTLRQWAPHLASACVRPALYRRLLRSMLQTLATDLVPLRPNRSEPRALKRRPKQYRLLTQPRRIMRHILLRDQVK
jgi:hypothetical protein